VIVALQLERALLAGLAAARARGAMIVALSMAFLGACQYDPKVDATGFKCHGNANCPSGYSCVKASGQTEGICCNLADNLLCLVLGKDAGREVASARTDANSSEVALGPDAGSTDLGTVVDGGAAATEARGPVDATLTLDAPTAIRGEVGADGVAVDGPANGSRAETESDSPHDAPLLSDFVSRSDVGPGVLDAIISLNPETNTGDLLSDADAFSGPETVDAPTRDAPQNLRDADFPDDSPDIVDAAPRDSVDAATVAAEVATADPCNYLDDNGSGSIDERSIYAQVPGTRQTIDESPMGTGVWWLGRSPNRVAVSWSAGEGMPYDNVRIQLLDLLGNSVGPQVTFGGYQASNWNAPLWAGSSFMVVGTTRSYDCAGDPSTTCATYGVGIDSQGNKLFGPSPLIVSTSATGGFVVANGEVLLTLPTSGETTSPIPVRSFTASGQPGLINTTLITPQPGESVCYIIRGAVANSEIYWIYGPSSGGFKMLVTGLDATALRGPFSLRATGGIINNDRGGSPIVVNNGSVYVLFNDGTNLYLGRWSGSDGTQIGSPTPVLANVSGRDSMGFDGGQFYVVGSDANNNSYLARLSLAGALVQAPALLPFPANVNAVAATPTGAIVAGGTGSDGILRWARFGCP
jgi:hypothetical protein